MRMKLASTALAAALACAALLDGRAARSDGSPAANPALYGAVTPDQIEFISTPDRIKSIASSGSPMAIWEALEHGERVECLDCIPAVEPLLYDASDKTREIAAWWLRRRVFGVFGPGQVYERTIATLKGDSDPGRRAYAASALGEFLAAPGVGACAAALSADPDARVRAAAATALGRLNDDGGGALGKAMGDADSSVKIAAMSAASRVSQFTDVASVARALGDGDARVRRRALLLLDAMHGRDAVGATIALAQRDADPDVRAAACHALGAFGDPSARATLEQIASSDANGFVRDQAQIALRRL